MDINQIRITENSIYFVNCINEELAQISADINGNISVNSGKISEVRSPTEASDAANKSYVDSLLLTHNKNNKNPHKVNKKQIGLEHVQNIKTNNSGNGPPTVQDNLTKGYINGSRWLDIINNLEYVCFGSSLMTANWLAVNDNTSHSHNKNNPHEITKEQIGLGNIINIKNNYNADGPPTDLDNKSKNYEVGSRWIDTVNKLEYLCFQCTESTATWLYNNLSDNSFDNVLTLVNNNTNHSNNKNNPHTITKEQIGLGLVENIKHNWEATANPQAYDDEFFGYSDGSMWVNKNNSKIFVCINSALNRAQWKEITNFPDSFGINLGNGQGVYSHKLDNKLYFKSIKGGRYIKVNTNNNELIVNASNSHSFLVCHVPIDVISDTYSNIFYFPWKHSEFSNYKNGKIIFHADVGNKSLSVQLYNKTEDSVLGVKATITSPGFYSFPVANPSGDSLLIIQVKKSINYGTDPRLYGIVLKYDS